MSANEAPKRFVSVQMPSDLVAELERVAKQDERSLSAQLRFIALNWAAQRSQAPQGQAA